MTRSVGQRFLVGALLLFFFLLVTTASSGKSATYDESVHLFSGWRILTAGDFTTNHEHPPLMRVLAALPLTLMNLDPPPTRMEREVDKWQAAHEFVFHVNDADRVLKAARLPITLLATLMVYVVFRLAAAWLGTTAGLVALALVVFEPNILAHSGLVTTDLGMTAMTLFTFGAFLTYMRSGSRRWLIGSGVLFGLGLLTKFTAVLLAPVLVLAGALMVYLEGSRRWRQLAGSLAAVGGIGLLVLNAGYGFAGTFSTLRDFRPESQRFRLLAAGSIGAVPLPVPVEYVRGFDHTEAGGQRWWAYLFGRYSMTGWKYYYLAALAVKTPLPLLVLALAGMILWPWIRTGARESFQPIDALVWQVPVLVVLFAFTLSGDLKNIGLRYILPIYPFLGILGGVASGLRFKRSWLVFALVGWQAIASLWIYPDFLTFFNLAVGGASHGAEVLADSNLDWGQDLKQLGEYIRERRIRKIYVDYFGRSCLRYYGIKSTRDFEGGHIAVSATNLKSVYDDDKTRYSFLEGVEPKAVIGHSIFVYDVPRPPGWKPKRPAGGS